eukprot:CAMPEP_0178935558 /NCGR_PEP_ID=MMETSP0786-20121207/24623_1 /TAXON_ID=186022 /ORGANISM="Thalassionema frauenfeldii, Strain CCMP 1798" /LENGTH=109 /DNA_ID=CAMNT_0020613741 /DNA_START=33 /DNA_END=362 /DNA_ORIENTATION=+
MATQAPTPTKQHMSDAARDARLRFKNFAEHQIRQEFKEEAQAKCAPEIRKFAECAQEKGLLVIFSCRSFNQAITDCMYKHNSDEAFEKYLKENPGLLEKRTIQSKESAL